VSTESSTDPTDLGDAAINRIAIPHRAIRDDSNSVKLEFRPRYSVVHDSSTHGADWSRNALHNLFERTAATGWGLLRASTGDQQAYQRCEPSEPSRAASHRREALA